MISEEEKEDLLGGAYDQGRDDGYREGREEVARKLQEMGLSPEQIKQATGVEL